MSEATMTTPVVTGVGIKKPRMATVVLALSMFMTGACGLVAEYVLSTTATYILGNSIHQFSIIIGIMVLMMGLAGMAQERLGDKHLIEKFIGIEILIAIIGGFAPISIMAAYAYIPEHFELILYACVAAIGFLIGFEIPVVLRINEHYKDSLKANIASVLAWDYIGSFVGALVWVFVLLKNFPITECSFIVAGTNFLVAMIAFVYFLRKRLISKRALTIALSVMTVVVLVFGYTHNRAWAVHNEQKLYDSRIIWSETTLYQHLVLTHENLTDDYRLFINGNVQFSSVDEHIYHEQLVHPVMSMVPDHRRVLILGGGDGMALREVLKYDDVEEVLLVDLDSEMTKLFSTVPELVKLNGGSFSNAKVRRVNGDISEGDGFMKIDMETDKIDEKGHPVTDTVANVHVMNLDADKFMSHVQGYWNVIIIDFPDPNHVELAKLYSREFYKKVKAHLAETGMMVVQSTSPYHAKEAYLCVKRTMEAAGFNTIPYHDNVPSFGDWGWILGSKHPRKTEIDHISVSTKYLTPELFSAAQVFGKGWLDAKQDGVNILDYPCLLEYYIYDSWKVE